MVILMIPLMPRLMPHLIGLLIVTTAALSGCTSEHERELNAARSEIRETIQIDWSDGIPVAGLIHAGQLCKKYGPMQECDLVAGQLLDITVSLASCTNDMRSTLCQKVVTHFEKSPFAYLMSISKPVALPDSPFYWAMPTAMLEVLAARFEYRAEATRWWWEQWYLPILSCIAASFLVYISLVAWTYWERHQETKAELRADQEAILLEHENARQASHARLRAEAKARAEAETQQRLAEQERIEATKAEQERLAQKQAAEQAIHNKLAAEQAEAQQLLSAAFSNTKKPKRRKHDSSSK